MIFQAMMQRPPGDRFLMGIDIMATALSMVRAPLPQGTEEERQAAFPRRIYGDELTAEAIRAVAAIPVPDFASVGASLFCFNRSRFLKFFLGRISPLPAVLTQLLYRTCSSLSMTILRTPHLSHSLCRRFLFAAALHSSLLLTASMAQTTAVPAAEPKSARPNIIYILADDMGFADVGFNGGKDIKTPALDALAAGGAKLDSYYVQPVCSPTRAALMTGRYPFRHGLQTGVVRPWAQYGLPLEERTLAQALQETGYVTAICGKWHLGHFQPAYLPTVRGFDHQYGHYNGALDYFTHMRDGGFDWHRDGKECRDEGYSTHLLAKEAVRLIKEHDVSKPLFLYVPFNAVHSPHQVPAPYVAPYSSLPKPRQTYAGMLAAMDEAIGQIVSAIDAKGLRETTLFIFSSDNGGPAPGRVTDNGSLRGQKGTLYEGGVRVAALASWKGKITAGTTISQPIHIVDWFPTLLKLAGAPTEQKLPVDGRDIWPVLTQGAASPHTEIILNSAPGKGAIRMGDWKLVINGAAVESEEDADESAKPKRRKSAEQELFNLAEDRSEKRNVAAQHPDKVKELLARYQSFAKQAVEPKDRVRAKDFKAPKVWGQFE